MAGSSRHVVCRPAARSTEFREIDRRAKRTVNREHPNRNTAQREQVPNSAEQELLDRY